jgi:hypothetical protein
MDPSIWGGKLWNIIYDIAWMLERRGNTLTSRTKFATAVFFQSMNHLLPCSHCRVSYHDYVQQLSIGSVLGPPCGKGALRWAYDLKNMVSRKLGKKDAPPTYECFERRMKSWTSASSADDLWDILSVYAMNSQTLSQDTTPLHKKEWMMQLLTVLPSILIHLPHRKSQAEVLQYSPPILQDMKTRNSILKYISDRANLLDDGGRTAKEMVRKYGHCTSTLPHPHPRT